jgi:hypothetical protein
MTLKFEIVKRNLDDPNFSESQGYFYDTRPPNSGDDDYINSIGFGSDFLVFWWDQSANNLYQLTNWGNSPLVWNEFVDNANLLSLIAASGWQINTPRNYSASGISLNSSRQPSTTNDIFVVASINLVNTVSTTTTVTVEVSPDNSTWTTAGQIADTTGVASNTTSMINFVVPQTYYYRLVGSGNGTITLISCNELSF